MTVHKPPPKKTEKPPPKSGPTGESTPAQGSAAGGVKKIRSHLAAPKESQAWPIGGGKSAGSAHFSSAKTTYANVEDQVYALLQLEGRKDNDIFKTFIEQIAPKLVLARTSLGILKSFSNIDVTAKRLSDCLKANPYYEFTFKKVIDSIRDYEDPPSMEAAVIMLGMQRSRNLIVALQALRSIRGTHPQWDKNDHIMLAPQELLKYALQAEEELIKDKSPYADTAYAGGLLFDLMEIISAEISSDHRKVSNYIGFVYKHGLRSAKVAMELVKSVPDFSFSKHLFSACLVHDVGKIAMAILDPEYLKLADDLTKQSLTRPVRQFAEEQRFGLNHAALGGLICHYFQMLRPVEMAILYHHQPYMLRGVNRNLFQLCSLICLTTNMANNFKRVDRLDDPVLASWKGMDLQDFNIPVKSLVDAVAKVTI
jgi:HD-like signal output (HDOD) protein